MMEGMETKLDNGMDRYNFHKTVKIGEEEVCVIELHVYIHASNTFKILVNKRNKMEA